MKAGNLWYQKVEEPATRDWGGAQGDLRDSNLNDYSRPHDWSAAVGGHAGCSSLHP